jgi:hypothetical protein
MNEEYKHSANKQRVQLKFLNYAGIAMQVIIGTLLLVNVIHHW